MACAKSTSTAISTSSSSVTTAASTGMSHSRPYSGLRHAVSRRAIGTSLVATIRARALSPSGVRSEEHTSELQSRFDLVCRLLLEKKNKMTIQEFDGWNPSSSIIDSYSPAEQKEGHAPLRHHYYVSALRIRIAVLDPSHPIAVSYI